MHQPNSAAQAEIRRAKTLAAKFARLEREIAALDPVPSMPLDPTLELDPATRALADEWLDARLDAPTRAANPTNLSGHLVRV